MQPTDQAHDYCLHCRGLIAVGGQAVGMTSTLGEKWVYWLCRECYAREVKQQEALTPALADNGHQVAIAMWARMTGWSALPTMHERHLPPRHQ